MKDNEFTDVKQMELHDRNYKLMVVGVVLLAAICLAVLAGGSAAVGYFIGSGWCAGAMP